MLRVTFQSTSDRNFTTVLQGLAALGQSINHGDASGAFTLFNVATVRSGREASLGVEMVEIHNDADNIYSSAIDQVVSSIQRLPVIDGTVLEQARNSKYSWSGNVYPMLPGRLFSIYPAALGFVVRQASGSKAKDAPLVMRMEARCPNTTAVLDVMNQIAEIAKRSQGTVSVLVQGIEGYRDQATLVLVFAGDVELLAFVQDQQAHLLAQSAGTTAGQLKVQLEGTVGGFAERATSKFISEVSIC